MTRCALLLIEKMEHSSALQELHRTGGVDTIKITHDAVVFFGPQEVPAFLVRSTEPIEDRDRPHLYEYLSQWLESRSRARWHQLVRRDVFDRKGSSERPPEYASRLLSFLPLDRREEVIGDLEESFHRDVKRYGVVHARRAYRLQVFYVVVRLGWRMAVKLSKVAATAWVSKLLSSMR